MTNCPSRRSTNGQYEFPALRIKVALAQSTVDSARQSLAEAVQAAALEWQEEATAAMTLVASAQLGLPNVVVTEFRQRVRAACARGCQRAHRAPVERRRDAATDSVGVWNQLPDAATGVGLPRSAANTEASDFQRVADDAHYIGPRKMHPESLACGALHPDLLDAGRHVRREMVGAGHASGPVFIDITRG